MRIPTHIVIIWDPNVHRRIAIYIMVFDTAEDNFLSRNL